MAEIRVDRLRKTFGDFVAVQGSTFTIPDGNFFVMLGPSGCGKTTTLRMIAGLELPTSGSILLDGEDVSDRRASQRDIAFVFQLFALYPHMTVYQNIAFPLRCQGGGRAETRRRVDEVARLLQIERLLDLNVSGLSGGDRQRVALGRAIVRRPKAFMMDEPLGALDSEFRTLMCNELRALHDRMGATTVYVTHDQLEAMAMADTIAVMNHGVVEQCGHPQDIYDRPATLFVADFIGSPPMNFLPFRCGTHRGQRRVTLGEVPVDVPEIREDRAEAEVVLGVRPEFIRLSDEGGLRGRVYGSEYLGTTQIVTVETDFGTVRARVPADRRAETGDRLGLLFTPERLSLFDKVSGRALDTALMEGARG